MTMVALVTALAMVIIIWLHNGRLVEICFPTVTIFSISQAFRRWVGLTGNYWVAAASLAAAVVAVKWILRPILLSLQRRVLVLQKIMISSRSQAHPQLRSIFSNYIMESVPLAQCHLGSKLSPSLIVPVQMFQVRMTKEVTLTSQCHCQCQLFPPHLPRHLMLWQMDTAPVPTTIHHIKITILSIWMGTSHLLPTCLQETELVQHLPTSYKVSSVPTERASHLRLEETVTYQASLKRLWRFPTPAGWTRWPFPSQHLLWTATVVPPLAPRKEQRIRPCHTIMCQPVLFDLQSPAPTCPCKTSMYHFLTLKLFRHCK